MSGNTGQHITVETVVQLPGFYEGGHMSNPYLHPCSSCDTHFAGEAMVLACFSSGNILSDLVTSGLHKPQYVV